MERYRRWEMMDPAIKLFGTTIPLTDGVSAALVPESDEASVFVEPSLGDVKGAHDDSTNSEVKFQLSDAAEGTEQSEPVASSNFDNVSENEHQESTHDDDESRECKSKTHPSDDSPTAEQKIIKKPDKILPCPRCTSMDTKFCYYNNYNVNQPRHFCRKCQRSWTAGGTMRNVPVGAGRRKSKSSASHHRQSAVSSDILAGNRVDTPDSGVCQALPVGLPFAMAPSKPNNNMLQFGSEGPPCESMTSVLNLEDRDKNAGMSYGEKGPSSACPRASSDCTENDLPKDAAKNGQNHILNCSCGISPASQLHYLPVPPWVYPWPPAWYNFASIMPSPCLSESVCKPENGSPNVMPSYPPFVAAPAYYSPNLPYPFFPTSFWGCRTSWPNGVWHAPSGRSGGSLSPPYSSTNAGYSGISSPTLGKHSRDGTLQEEQIPEKSLWVPKTLRIDDPDEAAKSSIWATLGFKPDESIKNGGIFKHLNCKNENKDQASDAAQVLQANPAALSRSHAFQEIT